MRKLLILAVAVLLMVAFAAPSFAAETTFTGSYRIRGVSDWNWGKDVTTLAPPATFVIGSGDNYYTGYFDQRFRLTITHTRSEFLKAVVSVDLVEDVWGQQRNFLMNNTSNGTDGFINTAYIQATTKIGLFKLGVDNIGGRFGHGTWSDSGMNAGDAGNPGITWGIKIDNFVATVSYIKYVDLVDSVFTNKTGAPAGYLQVWPGPMWNPANAIGGPGSDYRNADLNTYVLTAHYLTDNVKVGLLYQLIHDPKTISAAFLVGGISDQGFFAGEPLGYSAIAGWPTPTGAMGSFGFGRTGMYDSWLHIMAAYADFKFLDGKLRVKAEYDRIWGTASLNSRGAQYNATLPALYNLRDITVDGHTVYADVSYDFDVAKVGVAFLYGAGERHWRPYTQTHLHFNTTGNDDFHWGNIIVPGDSALLASGAFPLGMGNSPENVTSVKLYWSVDPMEKLDIHGAFIWAQYTQPVGRYADGNLTGPQAFYGHPMNYTLPADGSGGIYVPAHVSHGLGWEIDAGMTYEIMEGLSINSEFGVLFTGDAFDYFDVTTGATHSWGPIYRWVNTLTYEF
ncbi:MAG: hypothetical protein JW765_00220 [Deltaproteobacteria bacterium]|nr:hypothetical protein [Candidatus Zymogenaceae bacterium]